MYHFLKKRHIEGNCLIKESHYDLSVLDKTMNDQNVVSELSSIDNLKELNEEEISGLDFIKLIGHVSRKKYQEHFNFDKKKAERHLKKLVELNVIERKGSGPATYYELSRTDKHLSKE